MQTPLLIRSLSLICLTTLVASPVVCPAQPSAPVPVLHIDADQSTGKVSPLLYGLMTEEINYSYEGGLYGELIRNRSFKASTNEPAFWNTVSGATISLDTSTPLNSSLNVSLKVNASSAGKEAPAGIANGGYWGIPVLPKTTYQISFYAKVANEGAGPLMVSLESADGQTKFASAKISGLTTEWKKFQTTLTTKRVKPSGTNVFKITTATPSTIWFQQVSLFAPTYKDRANGNRRDIMDLLAKMNPKFLRLPGGNYLEGNSIAERFAWKDTIGPVEDRPGHESPWGYWSTDGLGLLEYMEWCEDLNIQPVLAVYAGFSLPPKRELIQPGPDLAPYVQDALDEIEYVTGDASTHWGAERIKNGHPAPFPLTYIEVGNEDWFDRSGSYDKRFAQFYDAIKAKYPQLQIIATTKVKSRTPDLLDEHYYRSEEEMQAHALDYDKYPRDAKTKIFCGEWATRVGSPTPNMAGALGDGAWMTGMERNSDIVLIASYAPLFVNVSDTSIPGNKGGSMQWRTDLIGYDALNSYGSPSYYAQKMFSTLHGDTILATRTENVPAQMWQPPAKRRNGVVQPALPPQLINNLFFDATRDSERGKIYVKVVNTTGTLQPVQIDISGAGKIKAKGKVTVLQADSPTDTNSLQQPEKIVPVTEAVKEFGNEFTRTFAPYSITVLELSMPPTKK